MLEMANIFEIFVGHRYRLIKRRLEKDGLNNAVKKDPL